MISCPVRRKKQMKKPPMCPGWEVMGLCTLIRKPRLVPVGNVEKNLSGMVTSTRNCARRVMAVWSKNAHRAKLTTSQLTRKLGKSRALIAGSKKRPKSMGLALRALLRSQLIYGGALTDLLVKSVLLDSKELKGRIE